MEPRDGVNTGSWPTQLRYAQAGRLSEAVSELQCGASLNAWTPGGDVLRGEAYLNWVIDLCALHFVLSPTLQSKIRGCAADKLYDCECCMVVVASWCHVKSRVLGKTYKQRLACGAKAAEPAPAAPAKALIESSNHALGLDCGKSGV